uniref:hypothetical protein n=1 Tax=Cupriavidus gilardii TaxID=82541 RepID=UPI002478D6A4|nr:hypothetical protein [Cupriavidus gilardii]WDE72651.1 hypothetical protein [Cupriavidus gilardii]
MLDAIACDATGRRFQKGSRCEIINVPHATSRAELGKWIQIMKVWPESRMVLAHDDKPILYRTNRNGRRVTTQDPRCVQTFYSMDDLKVWIDPTPVNAQQ